jgi:hypothetical protein
MIKRTLFFLFCFALQTVLLTAQDLSGLVRERIFESKNTPPYTNSWVPYQKDQYSYNSKGQRIYARILEWEQNSERWKIMQDINYEYDHVGNQIRQSTKEYDFFPDHIIAEWEIRTYYRYWNSNNHFDESGSYYHYINYADNNESVWEYHCDLDTIRQFTSCTFYDKRKSSNYISEDTNVSNTQRDQYGNIAWQSGWTNRNENGVEQEYFDSTVFHYDYDLSVNTPIQTDYYSKNSRNEIYSLISQDKRDLVNDSLGNLILEKFYSRIQNEDWILNYEYIFHFNENNKTTNKLSTYFDNGIPYSKDSLVYSYEIYEGNEMMVYYNFNWNLDDNIWRPDWVGGYVYNDNIFYTIYKYDWDKESGQFNIFYESRYSFYNDENGYKSTNHEKGYDLNIPIDWEYMSEEGSVYRCDGKIQMEYDSLVEGYTPADGYHYNYRITNYYYDLAACEEGEILADIQLFPNPTHAELNIYAEDRLGLTDILIVDSMGRETYRDQRDLNNFSIVNLEGYKPGFYVLKLNNDKINYSSKFIIQF